MAKYISQLSDYVRKTDEKALKAKLTAGELERTLKLSKDLLNVRLQKILRLAESGGGSEASQTDIEEEKEILKNVLEISKQYQSLCNKISAEVSGSTKSLVPTEPRMVLLRFLAGIPTIVGVDLKPYGPFRSEDIATLPLENGEILVSRRAALKIVC